ncbi:unnamed protein product [Amoebophrya sp. A25]|nr:unnamed protein product [Amoebophrya sp. A25]|eukprot:GSA25T00016517001.1
MGQVFSEPRLRAPILCWHGCEGKPGRNRDCTTRYERRFRWYPVFECLVGAAFLLSCALVVMPVVPLALLSVLQDFLDGQDHSTEWKILLDNSWWRPLLKKMLFQKEMIAQTGERTNEGTVVETKKINIHQRAEGDEMALIVLMTIALMTTLIAILLCPLVFFSAAGREVLILEFFGKENIDVVERTDEHDELHDDHSNDEVTSSTLLTSASISSSSSSEEGSTQRQRAGPSIKRSDSEYGEGGSSSSSQASRSSSASRPSNSEIGSDTSENKMRLQVVHYRSLLSGAIEWQIFRKEVVYEKHQNKVPFRPPVIAEGFGSIDVFFYLVFETYDISDDGRNLVPFVPPIDLEQMLNCANDIRAQMEAHWKNAADKPIT